VETRKLQKEFDLQEAVTNIGVQRIIDSVEEQYIEELNKDYFGYANQCRSPAYRGQTTSPSASQKCQHHQYL
jgi:hypothetical protein